MEKEYTHMVIVYTRSGNVTYVGDRDFVVRKRADAIRNRIACTPVRDYVAGRTSGDIIVEGKATEGE